MVHDTYGGNNSKVDSSDCNFVYELQCSFREQTQLQLWESSICKNLYTYNVYFHPGLFLEVHAIWTTCDAWITPPINIRCRLLPVFTRDLGIWPCRENQPWPKWKKWSWRKEIVVPTLPRVFFSIMKWISWSLTIDLQNTLSPRQLQNTRWDMICPKVYSIVFGSKMHCYVLT